MTPPRTALPSICGSCDLANRSPMPHRKHPSTIGPLFTSPCLPPANPAVIADRLQVGQRTGRPRPRTDGDIVRVAGNGAARLPEPLCLVPAALLRLCLGQRLRDGACCWRGRGRWELAGGRGGDGAASARTLQAGTCSIALNPIQFRLELTPVTIYSIIGRSCLLGPIRVNLNSLNCTLT